MQVRLELLPEEIPAKVAGQILFVGKAQRLLAQRESSTGLPGAGMQSSQAWPWQLGVAVQGTAAPSHGQPQAPPVAAPASSGHVTAGHCLTVQALQGPRLPTPGCAQMQSQIQERLAQLREAPAFQALHFEQAVAEMHDLVHLSLRQRGVCRAASCPWHPARLCGAADAACGQCVADSQAGGQDAEARRRRSTCGGWSCSRPAWQPTWLR